MNYTLLPKYANKRGFLYINGCILRWKKNLIKKENKLVNMKKKQKFRERLYFILIAKVIRWDRKRRKNDDDKMSKK